MPYDEKKSKSELIAELKAEREQVELLEQGLFALRREIARDTDCLERMQKDLERYETIVTV